MSDQEFIQEVDCAVKLYEKASGRAAGRTRQMIKRYGRIEALSRLMLSGDLQQGFKVLCDSNQLDKSFEAVVVRFQHVFKANTVKAAQWRLANPYQLL